MFVLIKRSFEHFTKEACSSQPTGSKSTFGTHGVIGFSFSIQTLCVSEENRKHVLQMLQIWDSQRERICRQQTWNPASELGLHASFSNPHQHFPSSAVEQESAKGTSITLLLRKRTRVCLMSALNSGAESGGQFAAWLLRSCNPGATSLGPERKSAQSRMLASAQGQVQPLRTKHCSSNRTGPESGHQG